MSEKTKIRCELDKGPTFGSGPDFKISNNCFSIQSTCYAPKSFLDMKRINEFNGGENKFLVKEVEVFLVEKK